MITVMGFTMGIILALIVGIGFGHLLFAFQFNTALRSEYGRAAVFKHYHDAYKEDFHKTCNCRDPNVLNYGDGHKPGLPFNL
jgi:hypothetical protein